MDENIPLTKPVRCSSRSLHILRYDVACRTQYFLRTFTDCRIPEILTPFLDSQVPSALSYLHAHSPAPPPNPFVSANSSFPEVYRTLPVSLAISNKKSCCDLSLSTDVFSSSTPSNDSFYTLLKSPPAEVPIGGQVGVPTFSDSLNSSLFLPSRKALLEELISLQRAIYLLVRYDVTDDDANNITRKAKGREETHEIPLDFSDIKEDQSHNLLDLFIKSNDLTARKVDFCGINNFKIPNLSNISERSRESLIDIPQFFSCSTVNIQKRMCPSNKELATQSFSDKNTTREINTSELPPNFDSDPINAVFNTPSMKHLSTEPPPSVSSSSIYHTAILNEVYELAGGTLPSDSICFTPIFRYFSYVHHLLYEAMLSFLFEKREQYLMPFLENIATEMTNSHFDSDPKILAPSGRNNLHNFSDPSSSHEDNPGYALNSDSSKSVLYKRCSHEKNKQQNADFPIYLTTPPKWAMSFTAACVHVWHVMSRAVIYLRLIFSYLEDQIEAVENHFVSAALPSAKVLRDTLWEEYLLGTDKTWEIICNVLLWLIDEDRRGNLNSTDPRRVILQEATKMIMEMGHGINDISYMELFENHYFKESLQLYNCIGSFICRYQTNFSFPRGPSVSCQDDDENGVVPGSQSTENRLSPTEDLSDGDKLCEKDMNATVLSYLKCALMSSHRDSEKPVSNLSQKISPSSSFSNHILSSSASMARCPYFTSEHMDPSNSLQSVKNSQDMLHDPNSNFFQAQPVTVVPDKSELDYILEGESVSTEKFRPIDTISLQEIPSNLNNATGKKKVRLSCSLFGSYGEKWYDMPVEERLKRLFGEGILGERSSQLSFSDPPISDCNDDNNLFLSAGAKSLSPNETVKLEKERELAICNMTCCPVIDYILLVAHLLEEETTRTENILGPSRRERIQEILVENMVERHAVWITSLCVVWLKRKEYKYLNSLLLFLDTYHARKTLSHLESIISSTARRLGIEKLRNVRSYWQSHSEIAHTTRAQFHGNHSEVTFTPDYGSKNAASVLSNESLRLNGPWCIKRHEVIHVFKTLWYFLWEIHEWMECPGLKHVWHSADEDFRAVLNGSASVDISKDLSDKMVELCHGDHSGHNISSSYPQNKNSDPKSRTVHKKKAVPTILTSPYPPLLMTEMFVFACDTVLDSRRVAFLPQLKPNMVTIKQNSEREHDLIINEENIFTDDQRNILLDKTTNELPFSLNLQQWVSFLIDCFDRLESVDLLAYRYGDYLSQRLLWGTFSDSLEQAFLLYFFRNDNMRRYSMTFPRMIRDILGETFLHIDKKELLMFSCKLKKAGSPTLFVSSEKESESRETISPVSSSGHLPSPDSECQVFNKQASRSRSSSCEHLDSEKNIWDVVEFICLQPYHWPRYVQALTQIPEIQRLPVPWSPLAHWCDAIQEFSIHHIPGSYGSLKWLHALSYGVLRYDPIDLGERDNPFKITARSFSCPLDFQVLSSWWRVNHLQMLLLWCFNAIAPKEQVEVQSGTCIQGTNLYSPPFITPETNIPELCNEWKDKCTFPPPGALGAFCANPNCRFSHHHGWRLKDIAITLGLSIPILEAHLMPMVSEGLFFISEDKSDEVNDGGGMECAIKCSGNNDSFGNVNIPFSTPLLTSMSCFSPTALDVASPLKSPSSLGERTVEEKHHPEDIIKEWTEGDGDCGSPIQASLFSPAASFGNVLIPSKLPSSRCRLYCLRKFNKQTGSDFHSKDISHSMDVYQSQPLSQPSSVYFSPVEGVKGNESIEIPLHNDIHSDLNSKNHTGMLHTPFTDSRSFDTYHSQSLSQNSPSYYSLANNSEVSKSMEILPHAGIQNDWNSENYTGASNTPFEPLFTPVPSSAEFPIDVRLLFGVPHHRNMISMMPVRIHSSHSWKMAMDHAEEEPVIPDPFSLWHNQNNFSNPSHKGEKISERNCEEIAHKENEACKFMHGFTNDESPLDVTNSAMDDWMWAEGENKLPHLDDSMTISSVTCGDFFINYLPCNMLSYNGIMVTRSFRTISASGSAQGVCKDSMDPLRIGKKLTDPSSPPLSSFSLLRDNFLPEQTQITSSLPRDFLHNGSAHHEEGSSHHHLPNSDRNLSSIRGCSFRPEAVVQETDIPHIGSLDSFPILERVLMPLSDLYYALQVHMMTILKRQPLSIDSLYNSIRCIDRFTNVSLIDVKTSLDVLIEKEFIYHNDEGIYYRQE